MPRIENKDLREAVLKFKVENDYSWSDICRLIGWKASWKKNEPNKQDIVRLKRTLGIVKNSGEGQNRRYVHEKTALEIINAIGRDPVEFGL